jgi:uncharacterized protein
MEPMKIAVVGAGIAGLSAAWLLSRQHHVTLLEREPRLGGHSNTVDVSQNEGAAGLESGPVPVDTGFIVYNPETYPNLVALFDHLNVETAESNMSFAFSLDRGAYEYSGSGLRGFFGQPSNLLSPSHYGMLLDIHRFFSGMRQLLATDPQSTQCLGDYLTANRYSQMFASRHLLPMAAAIWSAPSDAILAFPVLSFARFFANHGLLQVRGRPQWRTVTGGSRVYVKALMKEFRGSVELARGAASVRRDPGGVDIIDRQGRTQRFDACVIAAHADEALAMLDQPTRQESELLGAISYQCNRAVLHTDISHMPRRRRIWSSWNYLSGRNGVSGTAPSEGPCVTYWMNRLQPLRTSVDHFVTLNPSRPIESGAEIASFEYGHPVFDQRALAAQTKLWDLQGRQRTWFCGSYFGYGFHEDALQSGLAAAEHIGGVRRPWSVPDESGRIHIRASRDAGTLMEAAQ